MSTSGDFDTVSATVTADPECCDPTAELLASSSDAAALVRRTAFTRLRRGQRVPVAVLAGDTGQPLDAVRAALSELVTAGTATLNGDEDVVAVGGLSAVPAGHRLRLDGIDLWTWCAFDAIGIPAALGLDGLAGTRCPDCDADIEVALPQGRPPADSAVVGWLPDRPCTNVQADFCPEANLFCTSEHLARWQNAAGDPPGQAHSVAEFAALGKEVWAEMRRAEDRSEEPGAQTDELDVTLLYFEGCPSWRIADANLRDELAHANLTNTQVRYHQVETVEEAERLRFTGSPTILIDGVDPFGEPGAAVGLACRLYTTPEGLAGSPTPEQLRSALQSALSR